MSAQCAFPPHSIAQSIRMSCPPPPTVAPSEPDCPMSVLGGVENESLWVRRVKHRGWLETKMSREDETGTAHT